MVKERQNRGNLGLIYIICPGDLKAISSPAPSAGRYKVRRSCRRCYNFGALGILEDDDFPGSSESQWANQLHHMYLVRHSLASALPNAESGASESAKHQMAALSDFAPVYNTSDS